MIGIRCGQLPGRSPEGKNRNYIKSVNSDPLYHLNCLQINKAKIIYDDIYYQTILLSKIVLIGQVVHYEKAVSQRGMIMINTKIKDSTGVCSISFYFSQKTWQICQQKDSYVKIAATIKCGGVVFRPQIKIVGISMVLLEDYNQITEHYLECIKISLQMAS